VKERREEGISEKEKGKKKDWEKSKRTKEERKSRMRRKIRKTG
jgi:hypothetical protein